MKTKTANLELNQKPSWDVHLLGAGNRASSFAGVPRPLIAGQSGSAVSPHLSGWPVMKLLTPLCTKPNQVLHEFTPHLRPFHRVISPVRCSPVPLN